jgi:Rrf2 family protein
MLKLSKKVEYALMALMHMDELDEHELTTSREISGLYHIPPEALGKVLQGLAKADLIQSLKGAAGGYRLNSVLEDISLGDVMEAVEGPIRVAKCACVSHECQQEVACNIKTPIFHFQDQLLKFVYGLSLQTFKEGNSPVLQTAEG